MIEISQEEFEEKIKEVIQGKKSKSDLVKELQISSRTLNKKIQELSAYNSELYDEFIAVKPFRAKTRDDIDYEALIIEMIKNSMFIIDIAKKYNIGEKTIRRNAKKLEQENPELIALYKKVKAANSRSMSISLEVQEKIDKLVQRPVKIAEINEIRKRELENIETVFYERLEEFGTKEAAARSMGLTANRIYKLLDELYRIKIEENRKSFKENLKAETILNNGPINNDNKEHLKTNIEGVEDKWQNIHQ